jgi:hypothetical protein
VLHLFNIFVYKGGSSIQKTEQSQKAAKGENAQIKHKAICLLTLSISSHEMTAVDAQKRLHS